MKCNCKCHHLKFKGCECILCKLCWSKHKVELLKIRLNQLSEFLDKKPSEKTWLTIGWIGLVTLTIALLILILCGFQN